MQPTNIANPAYFHKVVDCQWACPAHTPVPEYIRFIAQGRYSDAYMINWVSNVFPGILGRTCDRPCEPACRRGRVEENNGENPEPVAICRLKRVAADILQTRRKAWRYRPFSFPLFTDRGNEQSFHFDFYIYDAEDSVIRLILVVPHESREVWDRVGRSAFPLFMSVCSHVV